MSRTAAIVVALLVINGAIAAVATVSARSGIGVGAAGWIVGGSMALLLGPLFGAAWATVAGVVLALIGTLIVGSELSPPAELVLYAVAALLVMTVLAATQLSFLTRRRAVLGPEVGAGWSAAHALAAAVGIGVAVVATAIARGIDWSPIVLPLGLMVLAATFGVVAVLLARHRAALEGRRTSRGAGGAAVVVSPSVPALPPRWSRSDRR